MEHGHQKVPPVDPVSIQTDELTIPQFRAFILTLSDDQLRKLGRELRFRTLPQVTFGKGLRDTFEKQAKEIRDLIRKRHPNDTQGNEQS